MKKTGLLLFCINIVLYCFFPTINFAQTSAKPCFTTNVVRGCAPLEVEALDCSGVASNLIFYSFVNDAEGKPSFQQSAKYTYTKAGKYKITQLINSGAGGARSDGTYEIEVFEPENPKVDVKVCGNGLVVTTISAQADPNRYFTIRYENAGREEIVPPNIPISYTYNTGNSNSSQKNLIVNSYLRGSTKSCGAFVQIIQPINQIPQPELNEIKLLANGDIVVGFKLGADGVHRLFETSTTGKKQTIDLPNKTTEIILSGRNIRNETYYYTLSAFDQCLGSEAVANQRLNTLNLRLETPAAKNTIRWSEAEFSNFEAYRIYKDDKLIETITNRRLTEYDDFEVTCRKQYCYQVEAIAQSGKIRSLSPRQCVQTSPFALLPSIPYLLSTVDAPNVIKLRWDLPQNQAVSKMILYKSLEGNTPLQIEIPPKSTEYEDTKVNTMHTEYCYQVAFFDDCGNSSPITRKSCPILLRLKRNSEKAKLEWNDDQLLRFEYFVERLDEDNKVIQTFATQRLNLFEEEGNNLEKQITKYRIRAILPLSNRVTYSNIVSFQQKAKIIMPNAFSPNNDGLNDVFSVKGLYIKDFRMQIFDRWGNIVHVLENLNQTWNGTSESKITPAGVYIYTIEATDTLGERLEQKGTITIVR